MRSASRVIRRGAFPAVLAAALAFGAAQALASPSQAAKQRAAACSDERCDAICVSHGHAGGSCLTGACRCFD